MHETITTIKVINCHLPEFPPDPFIMIAIRVCGVGGGRTVNIRSTLSADFGNTILFAVGAGLCNRSPELVYFTELEICT